MKESIRYLNDKIKLIGLFVNSQDIFVVTLIILVGFASFGLGRLSKTEEQKSPLQIISNQNLKNNEAKQEQAGKFVASKKGTRYYSPWCSQVKRINKKNEIWFSSKKEAEDKGYLSVKKCKGI